MHASVSDSHSTGRNLLASLAARAATAGAAAGASNCQLSRLGFVRPTCYEPPAPPTSSSTPSMTSGCTSSEGSQCDLPRRRDTFPEEKTTSE